MEKGYNRGIMVRTAENDMEAYLLLLPVPQNDRYTKAEVIAELQKKRVVVGVNEQEIEQMLAEERYGREVLIAKGIPPVDGKDGYFEFNFNVDFNTRPKIKPDGTVDYWSVHTVELVEEGQVIARYFDPIQGQNGVAVTGKVMLAKPGRNLPPLTGRGFTRSEDNRVYTATSSGKIEQNDNRIVISSIYEIFGDADLKVGNIDFRGDVLIHGNVTPGMTIKATGSITVDGLVEACTIEAGKDILLRSGVLGAHRTTIKAKGNICAKFIEHAIVECDGMLEASSAMNCTISCYDKVFMSGRHANIIGGLVYGARGVEADCFGSHQEVHTDIHVGVHAEVIAQYHALKKQIKEDTELVDKINEVLHQFEEMAREKNMDVNKDERRVALLRTKITRQAQIAKARDELERVNIIMERAKGATARAVHEVYSGVKITIDNVVLNVKDYYEAIEFVRRNEKIVMVSIRDELVG